MPVDSGILLVHYYECYNFKALFKYTVKLTQIGNSVGVGQMNATWRWISKPALVMLHDESLAEHGGAEGVRDEGLLDSASARSLKIVARSDATEPPEEDAFAAQAP